jgi:hypothetical protein
LDLLEVGGLDDAACGLDGLCQAGELGFFGEVEGVESGLFDFSGDGDMEGAGAEEIEGDSGVAEFGAVLGGDRGFCLAEAESVDLNASNDGQVEGAVGKDLLFAAVFWDVEEVELEAIACA